MKFDLRFVVFIGLFACLEVLAQNYTPENYETAADHYSRWLIRGLHHESLLSATPIGRYKRTLFATSPRFPLLHANEFGYSLQTLPVTNDMRYAQAVFSSTEGKDLKIHRLHFSQAFGYFGDFSLSGILNPDLKLYGYGADLKWNFFELGKILYTSARFSYSQNNRQERFKSKSFGIDLMQSFNLSVIDIYAGLRYLEGSIEFAPDPLEFEFKKRRYRSPSDFEKYYGVILSLSETTRVSGQFNQIDEEQSLLIKISFGTRTLVKHFPEWIQPSYD